MASSKSLARKNHSEHWWANQAPVHILRCTAHYKSNGLQCRHEATPGTNVCNQHGALIPAVQASAARRIQMSVDDAVKRLHEMLDDAGVDARDKIKILHDLLDRGGLSATSRVLVAVGQIDPVEKLFASLLSDSRMLTEPTPRALDPEFLALNRAVLDGDELMSAEFVDAEVIQEPSTAPRFPSPDPEPDQYSTVPPKHIRDDLELLGLL